MVSIYDVPPKELIESMAAELEKMPEMSPPEWADYVKTGVSKQRPPVEKNWWYIRAASVLRAVYKYGPIGVSKLRTKYSSRKNRGYAPDKTFKASGNILRKILQELEIIGFVKQGEVKTYKGRILTPKGKSFVDKLAVKIKKPYIAKAQAKKEEKQVPKEEKPVPKTGKKEAEQPKLETKIIKKEAKVEEPKADKEEEKVEEIKKTEKPKEQPKAEKKAEEKKETKKEEKPKVTKK